MTTEQIKTEWEKRCDYIKSSKNVNTDEIYNFFIEKIEQLQFELKAADSVNEQLQAKIDELEKANTNLEMQKAEVELENKDIKSILIKMSDKVVYTEQDRKDFWEFECECGFKGFSMFLLGGGQIADTGDFGDVFCPCCNKNH